MSSEQRQIKSQKQVRVQRPERRQLEWKPRALDQLIASDHRVRLVVAFVGSLDLSALYETINAVPGQPGRDAIDPQVLMALWLYATIEGVGSARRLDRLCDTDVAYQWILGGITVNYHTLSDFRTQHAAFLDQLLTQSVASLLHEGLIELESIAQDGMRVRASAGSSSFRREATLQRCLDEAVSGQVIPPAAKTTCQRRQPRRSAPRCGGGGIGTRNQIQRIKGLGSENTGLTADPTGRELLL
ncbi:transposase [Lacunimicrobium album]